MRTVGQMQATDTGFADVLALAPQDAFTDQRSRAFKAFTLLTHRAQAAGALRTDFVHQDLVILLMANAGLVRATYGNSTAWPRFTEYMLQAFHAPGGGRLPPPPTPRELFQSVQNATFDGAADRTTQA